MKHKTVWIYVLLACLFLLALAWQAFEHTRVERATRNSLVDRARGVAASLGVVIRSQGRFSLVPEDRLKAALDELVASTELEAVALLNGHGDIVAAAGEPIDIPFEELQRHKTFWQPRSMTLASLVALGPQAGPSPREEGPPVMVSPPRERGMPVPDRGPGPEQGPDRGNPQEELIGEKERAALREMMDGEPLDESDVERIIAMLPAERMGRRRADRIRETLLNHVLDENTLREAFRGGGRGGPWRRASDISRPPWMGEEEFDRIQKEQGIHWFLVRMPTREYHAVIGRDLQLRVLIAGATLLACIAAGVAWRLIERASRLEVRLARMELQAEHLQEMNMAAAGLVHETKNPLNLIRGWAQVIGRDSAIPESTRITATQITDEADRVTGRINQFLDYSRPPKPDPHPVDLQHLAEAVFSILAPDQEDKQVEFEYTGPMLTVVADEGMLRQVLFNLILNAVQAVPEGGHVAVHGVLRKDGTAAIEVRDNGPGVAEADMPSLFTPYFTTSATGTGLGLAVVRQIALAHNWAVAYEGAAGDGAVFRVDGIELAERSAEEDGS